MRNSAPALTVELGPNRLFALAAWLLPGVAIAALAAWLWVHVDHDGSGRLGIVSLSASALGVITLLAARHTLSIGRRPGRIDTESPHCWQATPLNCDRQTWGLVRQPDASRLACQVAVRLDTGGWLLLHLRALPVLQGDTSQAWTCWLALAQHQLPCDWHSLRCALYSTRPPSPPLNDR
ncbi:MAG: hypothetical protein IPG93_00655 [Burkholderiales bacterium]|nr:hypothetical protein [Burkholderiales bacterium]